MSDSLKITLVFLSTIYTVRTIQYSTVIPSVYILLPNKTKTHKIQCFVT